MITLGFIGTGKVGSTLARLSAQVGYTIPVIYNRTPDHALKLAEAVHARLVDDPLEVVRNCDLVLLAVSDDAIKPVANSLIEANWSGKGIVHTSGVHSSDLLTALERRGAMVGSLHPALPFANIKESMQDVVFAIETSYPHLNKWLVEFVSAVGGKSFTVSGENKALYHAALVFASNYTVTLYAIAERILLELGADRITSDNVLNTLVQAAVNNIQQQGIPMALTGPLVRNDLGTIQKHLDVLTDPLLAAVYRDLARLTYPLLNSTQNIEILLQQDEKRRATDNS